MTTPLFKRLKSGTTMYVLPGAAEDLSALYQNTNVSMTFSKFVLIKLPARQFGNVADPNVRSVFDIEGNTAEFPPSNVSSVPPATWGDAVVESLRNYVANQESTIRGTRVGATEYYYTPEELRTVSERIFWKWLRKNGALSLEPALPLEEWNPNADKFAAAASSDPSYLQRYLWRERQVSNYLLDPVTPLVQALNGTVAVKLQRSSNFRPGDYVRFTNFSAAVNGRSLLVQDVVWSDPNDNATVNDTVVVQWSGTLFSPNVGGVSTVSLDYEPVVKYIGEVAGVNNVQGAENAYTEVYATVPMQSGKTPSVLFETVVDSNYRPGMEFPVLDAQKQPQIVGAENDLSPIRTSPGDYPGDYLAQFDTEYNTYTTSTGDVLRRNGPFFGLNDGTFGIKGVVQHTYDIPFSGDQTFPMVWPQFNGSKLDGISLDFNIADYAVASAVSAASFGEFGASAVNGEAPADYEFNAILWYYDLQDVSGNTALSATNLYGIEFLDNPDRDDVPLSQANTIPVTKKLVANGKQDGTAFIHSLNFTFQVDSEDSPASFDESKVYSLFGFELYNEAMGRLALLTDLFYKTLAQVTAYRADLEAVKGLVYTQQSLDAVSTRMDSLDALLRLYSTIQIGSSSSVVSSLDTTVNPPQVRLTTIDPRYAAVYPIQASKLYDPTAVGGVSDYTPVPYLINIPTGKDFLVRVGNDDKDAVTYGASSGPLQVVLDKDLSIGQTFELLLAPDAGVTATKPLGVYLNYTGGGITSRIPLFDALDLPVLYNGFGVPAANAAGILKTRPRYTPRVVTYKRLANNGGYRLLLDFELDLLGLVKQGMLMRLNSFVLGENSGDVVDVSGMYRVSDISYTYGPAFDAQLVQSGTAEPGSLLDPVLTVVRSPFSTFAFGTAGRSTHADAQIGWMFNADGSVKTNIVFFQGGDGYHPVGYTEVELNAPGVTWHNGVAPKVRLYSAPRCRVELDVSIDALNNGSLFDNVSRAIDATRPLNGYLCGYPHLDFNNGYRVAVTRHADAPTATPADFKQRYSVNIESL